MKKTYFLKVLFATGLVCAGALFLPAAAKAATLSLSPTSNSVTVGSTFTVNINLDTTSQSVYGVDIYSLHFNPSILQVVDSDGATAGVQITAGTLMPNNQYNTVDNTNGIIQFSQTSATTGSNYTGSGVLATITFRGAATGSSAVTFDFTLNSTTDTNVASLYSDVLTAVTNGNYTVTAAADTTAPSTPTGLSATAASGSQINLSWTASTDNVVVTGYKIYRGGTQIATSTTTSYSNTGLTAGTSYTYTVAAYDAAGNTSAQSTSASATTSNGPDATAPNIPTGFNGQVISTSQINLSWTASTDPTVAGQNTSGVAGYKIYRGGTQIATTTSATTYSNTGLSAGTAYSYTIAAYDTAGNVSAQTSALNLTTQSNPDTTAPTISITNPSSSGQTLSGSITVSASASDPIVGGQVNSGLSLITLLIDGTVFATSTSGTISVSLDTATLLNTSHTLTATAKDSAGNIGTSGAVTFTAYNLSNATRYPRTLDLVTLEGLSAVPANTAVTAVVISPTTQAVLSTQPLTADASGSFSVSFQSTFPQLVSVRITVSGYLSRVITNVDTTINSGSAISVPTLYAGDFNSDGIINSLDFSAMNSHWNQNYPTTDINKDSLINSLDFAVLKNNWNKTGE
ncbi:MAG: fibronectin type III domain-containing protein [Candidatus Doudnabacteria bacterium]|nr:fibronectin type III domain-containing protein [Candidatus Doudnabacteria bacterium]